MVAVDLKKKFTVEAKEKQREAGKEYGEKHPKQELVAESPQALKPAPKSRDRAAQVMHVSARGVQDAQAVQDTDPKLQTLYRFSHFERLHPHANDQWNRARDGKPGIPATT